MDDSTAQEILRLRKRIEELEQTSSGAAGQLEELAQGEDLLQLHFSFSYRDPSDFRSSSATWALPSSWNEVFARISPLMIDQAADTALHAALNTLVQEKALPLLRENNDWKPRTIEHFRLAEDDFRAIIVQLRALNLIQEYTKPKRGVHDRSTYFRLTPAGDRQMVLLRAIRRKPRRTQLRTSSSPKTKRSNKKAS